MTKFRELIIIAIFFLALVYSQMANAKVVILQPNQPAPYYGYLFDHNSMKQATVESMELTEYKKLAEVHKQMINEQKSQLENNKYLNVIYFIGGAIVGGLVIKAAQ